MRDHRRHRDGEHPLLAHGQAFPDRDRGFGVPVTNKGDDSLLRVAESAVLGVFHAAVRARGADGVARYGEILRQHRDSTTWSLLAFLAHLTHRFKPFPRGQEAETPRVGLEPNPPVNRSVRA